LTPTGFFKLNFATAIYSRGFLIVKISNLDANNRCEFVKTLHVFAHYYHISIFSYNIKDIY